MKRSIIFLTIFIIAIEAVANIGDFSITPFVPESQGNITLTPSTHRILNTKLIQIITNNECYGGMDNRFVLTPFVNIINEETTADIPAKTVAKIELTFCLGDGISGMLYGTKVRDYRGIGDSMDECLASAFSKINSNDPELKALINSAKNEILVYYNNTGAVVINNAKSYAAVQNFEKAIAALLVIPMQCIYYDEAQKLMLKYAQFIVERDNNELLTKAKSAWAASPDQKGAEEAKYYLSQICITNESTKHEVNQFICQIQNGMAELQNKEFQLALSEIESQENIRKAEIQASAKISCAAIDTLPKVLYNIASWFIF